MPGSRLGLAAVLAAGALWAQLILLPIATALGQSIRVPWLSGAFGVVALVVAAAGFIRASAHPRRAAALLLAVFPIVVGAASILGGARPFARFDVRARSIAALTAVGFALTTLAWLRQLGPTVVTTTVAMDPVPTRPPAPPLRGPALVAIASVAGFLAVVAPAIITVRAGLTHAERLGGVDLVRARDALTSAGGLGIAILLVLGAGQPLVRGRASRRRRSTRGLAYLVWGVAAAGLLFLVQSRSLLLARWLHFGH
jgi:hypothetical protein